MNKRVLGAVVAFGLASFCGSRYSSGPSLRPSLGGTPAQAFGGLAFFGADAGVGGGGGRYFTGSRRDGLTCGVCHQSETYFGIEVRGFGESIVPGKTYTLTIAWEGEPNRVSFNGEIVGPKGFVAGELATPKEGASLNLGKKEDKRQIFNLAQDETLKSSEIEFEWTAPDKSFQGPISIHVAGLRFPDPDKETEEGSTVLDNTEQAIFSAVLPFGETKTSSNDKQGEDK